jgi:hypothetical protein
VPSGPNGARYYDVWQGKELRPATDSTGEVRRQFDLPGQWTDGPRNEQYDLLKDVPGETPEARRAYLLSDGNRKPASLQRRLMSAIESLSVPRVKDILALGADPNVPNPGSALPLNDAAWRLRPDIIKVLLDAGADPTLGCERSGPECGRDSVNALEYADFCSQGYDHALPGFEQRVAETISLLAGVRTEDLDPQYRAYLSGGVRAAERDAADAAAAEDPAAAEAAAVPAAAAVGLDRTVSAEAAAEIARLRQEVGELRAFKEAALAARRVDEGVPEL